MMARQGCWMARRMTDPRALALAALHGQAERMAEAIRASDPMLRVNVVAGEDGVSLGVSGRGLAAREFGTARRAPRPVVRPVVDEHGAEVAAAVGAAVAEGLEGR